MQDRVLDGDAHAAGADLRGTAARPAARRCRRSAGSSLVSHDHADVQAERLDVRERCGRSDGDRREQRKHLALEPLRQRTKLARPAILRREDPDPSGCERRLKVVAPEPILRRLERDDRASRIREGLRRRAAVGTPAGDSGSRLLPRARPSARRRTRRGSTRRSRRTSRARGGAGRDRRRARGRAGRSRSTRAPGSAGGAAERTGVRVRRSPAPGSKLRGHLCPAVARS